MGGARNPGRLTVAHAINRARRTTIYGPGDAVAGAFDHAAPIDDDSASARESAEDDAVLRDGWVRTLSLHEGEIVALRAAGDEDGALRLLAAVERSAYGQVQLATLDGLIDRVLVAGGERPSERNRAMLRRLVLGGRGERTWRRWRSGEHLLPLDAADYLSRLRGVEIVEGEEPDGLGRRLRVELVLDE